MAEINNLVVAEKSDLVAIANAIRAKSGRTDSMSFPYDFVSGIEGIASGDGEGSGMDGLEQGYDVMFYDENNEGLAFYSIKQGHTINPPVYAQSWENANGEVIAFPFTPTGDISIYAIVSNLDGLYQHYGIDGNTYPCVIICIDTSSTSGMNCKLMFGDVVNGTTTNYIQFAKAKESGYVSITTYPNDLANFSAIYDFVKETIQPSDLTETTNAKMWPAKNGSSVHIYTNFDRGSGLSSDYTYHRLDE